MFLSSYTNTSGSLGEREMLCEHEPQASVSTAVSGSLGEREMLCEHEPQASVSTAVSSSPKLSRVFV